ncbi:MAG: SMP-30/gluconolactonase/LRE family protein, partial [Nevskiales bacterium]
RLYFALTGSQSAATPGQGIIYTLPLKDQPVSDDLEVFFTYPEPGSGPDGIAFGLSGRLYVALAGSNQISILNPDGTEAARFPSAIDNQSQPVPYDAPASIAFDGRGSLLVTNHSFFANNAANWVVFDAWVNDTALSPAP